MDTLIDSRPKACEIAYDLGNVRLSGREGLIVGAPQAPTVEPKTEPQKAPSTTPAPQEPITQPFTPPNPSRPCWVPDTDPNKTFPACSKDG